MARFERPAGAIEGHADIRKWDVLWHVYGIWPPFMSGPAVVTRAPYSDPKMKSIVFDTREPRHDFVQTNFASDGNMKEGHSHNDNYWFRTEKEAESAKDWLRAQWESRTGLIDEVLESRRLDRVY